MLSVQHNLFVCLHPDMLYASYLYTLQAGSNVTIVYSRSNFKLQRAGVRPTVAGANLSWVNAAAPVQLRAAMQANVARAAAKQAAAAAARQRHASAALAAAKKAAAVAAKRPVAGKGNQRVVARKLVRKGGQLYVVSRQGIKPVGAPGTTIGGVVKKSTSPGVRVAPKLARTAVGGTSSMIGCPVVLYSSEQALLHHPCVLHMPGRFPPAASRHFLLICSSYALYGLAIVNSPAVSYSFPATQHIAAACYKCTGKEPCQCTCQSRGQEDSTAAWLVLGVLQVSEVHCSFPPAVCRQEACLTARL